MHEILGALGTYAYAIAISAALANPGLTPGTKHSTLFYFFCGLSVVALILTVKLYCILAAQKPSSRSETGETDEGCSKDGASMESAGKEGGDKSSLLSVDI